MQVSILHFLRHFLNSKGGRRTPQYNHVDHMQGQLLCMHLARDITLYLVNAVTAAFREISVVKLRPVMAAKLGTVGK